MRGLMWFKEDLRTIDNLALYHASKHCRDGVIGLYVLDPGMWKLHEVAPVRIEFILRGLKELQTALDKLNIPLIIIEVKRTEIIPQKILDLARSMDAQALFYNKQYEANELARDQAVTELLEQKDMLVSSFHDQVILEPGKIITKQGKFFSVFTPYKRTWLKTFAMSDIKILPRPRVQDKLDLKIKSLIVPHSLSGLSSTIDPASWPAGECAALHRLKAFVSKNIFQYDTDRDFPALDGTSKLSPYLAAGMISPRQCFIAALEHNHHELDSGNKGVTTWLGELIWRDFYKHVLVAVPRISKHRAFQAATDEIKWDVNETLIKAWQQGKTGYPLIDAAMRQMHATGWMHNRLRMVTAMFLTKNLFQDWRLGEKYFMENLVDGDLSANNGGWQWSASTGTDAAPYFRIFNPILQSKKFDPEGKFILTYCPELKGFDKKSIHEPYRTLPELAAKQGYPKPVIEINQNRERVLKSYKKAGLKKSASSA
jgi:deoxyribodipyrimidine photo-lyase